MSISGVEGQGAMSMQEIMDLMGGGSAESSSGAGFSSEMTDKLMTEFDSDGDGSLNETELAALTEKMQGMQDMMASLAQAMRGQPGEQGESGDESSTEDEEVPDVAGAFMESMFGSEESIDEADANGDGIVSEDELSDYLGAQFEEMQAQKGTTGKSQSLGQQLMDQAMSAYQVAADSSLSDSALSMFGGSDSTSTASVNAVA
ncbi:EF-hand domain-containing protein [Desulfovibrio ferrophilus]|uniref:EF hand repeat-containing protein n=1 Tax=Desulfovibrio ferrophilus TaxID=241368 RepID=A0A2Z6B271_9BACT|nr:EF-hand domain-containing protein [Desulfovibrio ferrophilus]BBD09506.1 EF hand repeat-containing protein [Desulfovibrio ferrophilus]